MDKCLERLMSFRFKLTNRVEIAAATKKSKGCDSENDSSSEKKDSKNQPKTSKLSTLDPPLRFKEHYLRSGLFDL